MLEWKAITGKPYRVFWRAPGFLTEQPEITVSAGSTVLADAEALSALRADVSIASVSGKALVADGPIAGITSGVIGDRGDAYFVTDEEGVYPVTVVDIDTEADTIYIADDLPRGAIGAGTLQWALWSAELAVDPVTEIARRNLVVAIDYKRRDGAGAAVVEDTAAGLLHVVDRRFETGLDHTVLVRRWPALADHLHRANNSFAPQIATALDDLIVLLIREPLTQRGKTEDDISLSGHRFRSAHAYLARAEILDNARLHEDAGAARGEGRRLALATLTSIVDDLDGDGEVDDPADLSTPARLDFGGGGFS